MPFSQNFCLNGRHEKNNKKYGKICKILLFISYAYVIIHVYVNYFLV